MRRAQSGIAALVTLLLALTLNGCASTPPTVTATWPVASSEATVAPPADALRFPLTGLSVSAGATYPISPACVKVAENNGIDLTFGLASADVVYETGQPGSTLQLAALFQSTVPGTVGPIAAAGMPDLWLLPQYRAALFSTGANATLAASIKRAGLMDLSVGSAAGGSAYQRLTHPKAASGTYVDGGRALEEVTALGSTLASSAVGLRFSDSAGTTSAPTAGVTIPFSASQVVDWAYDASAGRYLRSRNGRAQKDGSGRQISASNVVVMWVRYSSTDPDNPAAGFDATLGGSGQVTVFRNGQRLDGRWMADGQSPPTFAEQSGQAIRLAPGTTWFEVIPLSGNITMR